MTIARAQMNRQLYQMGGIGTLPMDYGQPLQVNNQSQMPAPNYSSAVNITANPLLNYGQTELNQSGGTPLTMRSGGMTRLGYQEGGMGIMGAMPQDQTMSAEPSQMDPQQAIEIIVQLLIKQGVPPEEARKIALQMVQAVAEGGMQEMSDERITARFGGSINNGRAQYGLGSFFSGIGKAVGSVVSGVTNAVKSVASSPIGKIALATAAAYFAPVAFGGTAGFGPGSTIGNFFSGAFNPSTIGPLTAAGEFGRTVGGIFSSPLTSIANLGLKDKGGILGVLTGVGLGTALGNKQPEQQLNESTADYQRRVEQYKAQYSPLLNPTVQYPNNPFYPQTQMAANGGRIGYQEGGIGDLVKQVTQQSFFGTPMMATGGRMGYAMGAEVPTRKNQAGIKELDYRQTGGFVPPIGIKEKADDIPAMLSNNEFVFTADAVRNAGGGNVDRGAEKMYSLMKRLENGGQA
jgi:hypothetical protein